jgi:hypothetical protein
MRDGRAQVTPLAAALRPAGPRSRPGRCKGIRRRAAARRCKHMERVVLTRGRPGRYTPVLCRQTLATEMLG